MQFSLLSKRRLASPPVFSLSFNVSDGPPTTVNCTVNGNEMSTELSRVIVDGPESITRVIVTVRLREAGNYQCTVSNDRVTAGTINGVTAVSNTSSLSIGGKYRILGKFRSAKFSRISRFLLSREIKFCEIITMPHLLYCTCGSFAKIFFANFYFAKT